MMQERLSPIGADIKALRPDAKRSFGFAITDPALTSLQSPTKKALLSKAAVSIKSETKLKQSKAKAKASAASATAAAAAAKRKNVVNHEVAALMDVVSTIQQQVHVASNGIRELQQLVNVHLQARSRTMLAPPPTAADLAPIVAATLNSTVLEPAPIKCVSPPAAIMSFDAPESGDMFDLLTDFPEFAPQRPQAMDSLLFYSGTPMPFSSE